MFFFRCQQNDDPQECDLFDVWESSNKKTLAYCADRIVYTPMKIDPETGLQVDDLSKQFVKHTKIQCERFWKC